jgi:hypothetical protein
LGHGSFDGLLTCRSGELCLVLKNGLDTLLQLASFCGVAAESHLLDGWSDMVEFGVLTPSSV